MINAIQLIGTKEQIYYDKNNLPLKYLSNINKINIFIGENNSGKSRMMRLLVNSEIPKVLSNKNSIKEQTQVCRNNILTKVDEINKINKGFTCSKNIKEKSDADFFIEIQEQLDLFKIRNQPIEYPINNYLISIESNLSNLLAKLCKTNSTSPTSITNQSPIYIPILRGIENFNIYFDISKNKEIMNSIVMNEKQRNSLEDYKDNAKHIYSNKIEKAYGIKPELIFTAENLYEDITNKLLGKEDGRTFIKEFQGFISKQFYDGKEFTLIPQKQGGYINVKIGKQEKPLYELGDGIKQLITMLYKIFENRNQSKIFFIEEPELNLHPGFQRKLIEILQLEIFNKHQFFITTHSNHFIDSSFDYDNISIYKFTNINGSNKEFKVTYTSPNDVSLLQSLGVNNSSVFMANCTIWVEGISDKILIKKYLETYFKEKKINRYKEDLNYAFVEYGGNNIVHWDFEQTNAIDTINSCGITNRSFIVCDNDDDEKKERKQKLKSIFKDNYYELTVREIENTISKKVLDKVLFGNEEVKYKKEFEQKDYTKKNIYMGNFIDEHYQLRKKYSNSKGSGTIINKLYFSKKIANNISNFGDLTVQAINLCKKLTEFIEKSNN